MPRRKARAGEPRVLMPASTPEGRLAQAASLAMENAIERLADGSASDALIIHILKETSEDKRLDRVKTTEEVELLKAKTATLKEAANIEQLYTKAIRAAGIYRGEEVSDEDYGDG